MKKSHKLRLVPPPAPDARPKQRKAKPKLEPEPPSVQVDHDARDFTAASALISERCPGEHRLARWIAYSLGVSDDPWDPFWICDGLKNDSIWVTGADLLTRPYGIFTGDLIFLCRDVYVGDLIVGDIAGESVIAKVRASEQGVLTLQPLTDATRMIVN